MGGSARKKAQLLKTKLTTKNRKRWGGGLENVREEKLCLGCKTKNK